MSEILHCSVRRLYKSLKFTHGRGKYTKKPITASTVTEVRGQTEPVSAIRRSSRASEVVAAATTGCVGAGGLVGGGGGPDLRWPAAVVVEILEAMLVDVRTTANIDLIDNGMVYQSTEDV
ncbi:hypothetical protein R6Q59_016514 [Mikania micrantha]